MLVGVRTIWEPYRPHALAWRMKQVWACQVLTNSSSGQLQDCLGVNQGTQKVRE